MPLVGHQDGSGCEAGILPGLGCWVDGGPCGRCWRYDGRLAGMILYRWPASIDGARDAVDVPTDDDSSPQPQSRGRAGWPSRRSPWPSSLILSGLAAGP
jgi:hypothetical protein